MTQAGSGVPAMLALSYALLHTPSHVTCLQDTQADLVASSTNMLMAHVNVPHLLLI